MPFSAFPIHLHWGAVPYILVFGILHWGSRLEFKCHAQGNLSVRCWPCSIFIQLENELMVLLKANTNLCCSLKSQDMQDLLPLLHQLWGLDNIRSFCLFSEVTFPNFLDWTFNWNTSWGQIFYSEIQSYPSDSITEAFVLIFK